MSFSITIHGHAGPGMDSNGAEEIAAVQQAIKDVRRSFARSGLDWGSVQTIPGDWCPSPQELADAAEPV